MKRFFGILLICMLVCAAAAGETVPADGAGAMVETLPGQTAGDPSTLTAIGSGVVALPPDIAVLTFQLSSTAATVAEAQNASAQSAEALYAALEDAGVSREDTYAVNYTAATVYSYQYGKLGEGESPSGFSVSSDVVVRLKDVQAVGTVIDIAMQNGASSSYEMSFESSQAQVAYDRALGLAAADALRKASLLAEASGLKLGRILSIREREGGAAPAGAQETMTDADAADSLRYEIQVTACVEVCYTAE